MSSNQTAAVAAVLDEDGLNGEELYEALPVAEIIREEENDVLVYSAPGFIREKGCSAGTEKEVQVVLSPLTGEVIDKENPEVIVNTGSNVSAPEGNAVKNSLEKETARGPLSRESLDETAVGIVTVGADDCDSQAADAEIHYRRGRSLFDRGLMDEALREFSIASCNPGRAAACAIRSSRCWVAKGEPLRALSLLKSALKKSVCKGEEEVAVRYQIVKIHEMLKDSQGVARELGRIRHLEVVDKAGPDGSANRSAEEQLFAAPARKLPTTIFLILVGAVLYRGWMIRSEKFLSPENGAGDYLGIAGSVLMLLLLLYPIRKKARFMRRVGAVSHWFKAHMILGIVGPALILFHANFNVGSFNSTVALAFTLIVASSGLLHVYVYSKIHLGLYGSRVTLQHLQEKTEAERSGLGRLFNYAPRLQKRLINFENWAMKEPRGIVHSVARILTVGMKARWTHLVLMVGVRRALRVTAKREGWPDAELRWQGKEARRILSAHMAAVLKVAEFSFWERLFSLWYFFHLPLFFVLVIVVLVHVTAVHMY